MPGEKTSSRQTQPHSERDLEEARQFFETLESLVRQLQRLREKTTNPVAIEEEIEIFQDRINTMVRRFKRFTAHVLEGEAYNRILAQPLNELMADAGITPSRVEEFEVFMSHPENIDRLFELLNGEIVEKVPTPRHAYIVGFFSRVAGNYLDENPIATILPEVRCLIPEDPDEKDSYIPDLGIVLKVKGRKLFEENALPFMPELVIEVQSPGQSEAFMTSKAEYYIQYGAKLVWVIYPETRTADVFTKSNTLSLTGNDELDGSTVLPGFKVSLKKLFAGLDEE